MSQQEYLDRLRERQRRLGEQTRGQYAPCARCTLCIPGTPCTTCQLHLCGHCWQQHTHA